MLFLGSFRHEPERGGARLVRRASAARHRGAAAGSAAGRGGVRCRPSAIRYADRAPAVEIRGFVEDIREPLGRYAVFVCPIRSGSGVRVKLLEAFASGIPVVSTPIGAEGLARADGEFCLLADDPEAFAARVLRVFEDAPFAAGMAARARAEVAANWDMAAITARLVESYGDAVREKNPTATSASSAKGPV